MHIDNLLSACSMASSARILYTLNLFADRLFSRFSIVDQGTSILSKLLLHGLPFSFSICLLGIQSVSDMDDWGWGAPVALSYLG